MHKLFPILILIFFWIFLISACAPAPLTPAPTQDPSQPMLNRDAAASYSAGFLVQFNGTKNWNYLLKTRKSATLREINLHIEGVQGGQNLGDIRMVTDNATTWMIGAGTDQQCVQFPNGQGLDPTYIYPESLVSLKNLGAGLKPVGEERLEGITVMHFRATGAASGPWRDATIDLWQEIGSGMLRQFTMTASGEDPFFASGPGKLNAVYNTAPLDSEEISPVSGCEISVPLPEGINTFVRLPGMASFKSRSSVADLVKFYQSSLPGQKWVEKSAPAQNQGDTVLSYQRGAESVEIHLASDSKGAAIVKLLFIQGQ
jgi:hypothetical protein